MSFTDGYDETGLIADKYQQDLHVYPDDCLGFWVYQGFGLRMSMIQGKRQEAVVPKAETSSSVSSVSEREREPCHSAMPRSPSREGNRVVYGLT